MDIPAPLGMWRRYGFVFAPEPMSVLSKETAPSSPDLLFRPHNENRLPLENIKRFRITRIDSVPRCTVLEQIFQCRDQCHADDRLS